MFAVPALDSVTIHFDPLQQSLDEVVEHVRTWLLDVQPSQSASQRHVEIPVCYEAEFALDLSDVAAAAGLSEAEVIRRHAEARYVVQFLGFAPGFPYLLGLPEELHTPRRATPRVRVPAGSVGIGGRQTGIYPQELPGGWNIIGRTPLTLFNPLADQPTLLQPGDTVRFVPVTVAEYRSLPATACATGSAHGSRATDGCLAATDNHIVRVLRAGLLTTVQDSGRRRHRHLGVPVSGVMDPAAAELANRLVGNHPEAAVLELTLVGDELEFTRESRIALTGAEFNDGSIRTDAGRCRLPQNRPVRLPPGAIVQIGRASRGCRGYLAIAGGFQVPMPLSSRSTLLRSRLGGLDGRSLQPGDELLVGPTELRSEIPPGDLSKGATESSQPESPAWFIRVQPLPREECVLRIVPGQHLSALSDRDRARLFSEPFRIDAQSDRMGYRLRGTSPLQFPACELASAGTVIGQIQLPPDGHPLLLMADAAPTGGYPCLGYVISADRSLAAQLRPGQSLRLQLTTRDDAVNALKSQADALQRAVRMVCGWPAQDGTADSVQGLSANDRD
jgi:KipI family sensor histidine kinase inhibitor